MTLAEHKAALRADIRARLRQPAPDSTAILAAFRSLTLPDGPLLAFVPWRGEVNVVPILSAWLEDGRTLLLPRVDADGIALRLYAVGDLAQLVAGYQGIREPDPACSPEISPDRVAAALIPGLAFDLRGTRLGQGKGHYDRLLPQFHPGARRIGTCHAWQLLRAPVAPLPRETHDVLMHGVLTPEGYTPCEGV